MFSARKLFLADANTLASGVDAALSMIFAKVWITHVFRFLLGFDNVRTSFGHTWQNWTKLGWPN
jgi:hypothetical protein